MKTGFIFLFIFCSICSGYSQTKHGNKKTSKDSAKNKTQYVTLVAGADTNAPLPSITPVEPRNGVKQSLPDIVIESDTNEPDILPADTGISVRKSTSNTGLNGAQEVVSDVPVSKEVRAKEEPYVYTEVMPEFPGGEDSMRSFIKRTEKYPTQVKEDGIEETIYIRFVVEKDGSLTDITIAKGFNKELCKAAIDCIKAMPKWSSGKMKGKEVRVSRIIPVRFRLE